MKRFLDLFERFVLSQEALSQTLATRTEYEKRMTDSAEKREERHAFMDEAEGARRVAEEARAVELHAENIALVRERRKQAVPC